MIRAIVVGVGALLAFGGAFAGTCVQIPLCEVANASRLDDEAADEKGGWLDLGSNDLRVLPSGKRNYAGVTFDVPACADACARTCCVLGRSEAKRVELPVSGTVRGGRFYLLHALADGPAPEKRERVADILFSYADGKRQEVHVRAGRDAGDWTSGSSFENAVRCWTAYNGHTQVSLFVSGFDLDPNRELKTVVFEAKGVCPWMVLAATVGKNVTVEGLRTKSELTGTFRAPPKRTAALKRFPEGRRPKNVILVIGDGMGPGCIRMASLYQHGAEDALQMQQMPVAGLCTTQPIGAPVTDSAAAATAFATGSKTSCGVLGLGIRDAKERKNPRPLVSVAALAHARGQAVALLTNDRITGATPAAFYAHVTGRGAVERVAEQAAECGFEILVGSRKGDAGFRPESCGGQRKDGRDVIAEMEKSGYVCVTSRQAFAEAPRGAKVIGFYLEEPMPEDSLAAATKTALARVGDSPKGFFMMCESAATDHGNHANNPSVGVHGALQVDWTAAAALDFAESRDDTLVIVTADHETGGMSVARSRSDGKVTVHYAASSHTAAPVAIFAYGPGAECFEGVIDNTDIANSLKRLLGFPCD